MIVHGMFVCSCFLISVCMFIVSKALLISSVTVIVRAGGAIWLNPFATVLFSVCSAVSGGGRSFSTLVVSLEMNSRIYRVCVQILVAFHPA